MLSPAFQLRKRLAFTSLALVGFLLMFALYSEKFASVFYAFVFWGEALMSLRPILGAIFFFLVSCLSALLAFASSLVLIPSALLAWGAIGTFFLLWAGWLAGAAIAYWAGSRLARPLFTSWSGEQKIARYQQLVSRKAHFWMVLLFCLAVPSEIPGYVFGTLRYPFGRFMIAIALSEALYAAAALLVARNLLRQEIWTTGGIVFSIFVLAGIASFFLIRQHQKNRGQKNASLLPQPGTLHSPYQKVSSLPK